MKAIMVVWHSAPFAQATLRAFTRGSQLMLWFEKTVDKPCLYCEKPIQAGDQGVMMPLVSIAKPVAAHLDCYLERILPHTFTKSRAPGDH
jgi:hypothetical protein